jgi:putative membrane protein
VLVVLFGILEIEEKKKSININIQEMIEPLFKKNDVKANWLIGIFSFVVFAVVVSLNRIKLDVQVGFDVHVFALANAIINSLVAICLVAALWAVKNKKFQLHRNLMFTALLLSILFLVSYIAHHILAGETKFGGEGFAKYLYFFILITHIFLASVILPFILFTSYRALIGEFDKHKKLAKITFPIWLYVAITGPVVYFMISPYYN